MKQTEQKSLYDHLERMNTVQLLEGINTEDRKVPEAVAGCIPQIARFVDGAVERVRRGGRIFYIGAGTSGRLGIADAAEIPPTFGMKDIFIGIIAGGDKALRNAVEGAEDESGQGWKDVLAFNPGPEDCLVGVSASGSTPYVVGALREARKLGMLTASISCNEESATAAEADIPIVAIVGPEFLTGSTRMKSGTATKMILNMISTSVMIRLGRVKGNRMVDMQLTSNKLVDRGTRMIMEETGITDYAAAKELLLHYGGVRAAIAAISQK
ncbi:MAG: N-acetylmuramic acid 6-phosphate etherase [Bacteroidales bacterium]|nr:N-acetylmuramic acid 6-phosphate etherase [Bacteroidales bacterium]MBR5056397.1 N-acetylmuramic acid 6-phosphate etherase [Bacteroidales bacterium]